MASAPIYDTIGTAYTATHRTEPRISAQGLGCTWRRSDGAQCRAAPAQSRSPAWPASRGLDCQRDFPATSPSSPARGAASATHEKVTPLRHAELVRPGGGADLLGKGRPRDRCPSSSPGSQLSLPQYWSIDRQPGSYAAVVAGMAPGSSGRAPGGSSGRPRHRLIRRSRGQGPSGRGHCARPGWTVGAVSYCPSVARQTVKLLLVDPDRQVLLVNGRDPATGRDHWYPVGGGVDPGESIKEAAAREAWEETGLDGLSGGVPVWVRDAIYTFAGQSVEVHEDWLHCSVGHFDPAPARLTDSESRSVLGFRWWTVEELRTTDESVFPPDLGDRLAELEAVGPPATPVDIG